MTGRHMIGHDGKGKLSKIIFKKHMEFSICKGGGGSGRVIFHMFTATHQNAFKAILSIFRHFYLENLKKLVLHFMWTLICKLQLTRGLSLIIDICIHQHHCLCTNKYMQSDAVDAEQLIRSSLLYITETLFYSCQARVLVHLQSQSPKLENKNRTKHR